MSNTRSELKPRWLTFKAGAKHCGGVSIRTLENWEKTGAFKVARVIAAGRGKGTRLIDRESLDEFIQSFVGNAPQVIAMNSNRGGQSL